MKPFTFLAAMSACLLGHSATVHAQDVEAGEKVFGKCVACHKVGEWASNGFGPVLNDVIGRTAGTYERFGYSNTLRKAGEAGLVQDVQFDLEVVRRADRQRCRGECDRSTRAKTSSAIA